MSNLDIYNALKSPPDEALTAIKGGRLSGKSSINPMWRIKALTEQFGVCGVGWKYTIDKQWLEPSGTDEIAAFVEISLFVKVDGKWSDAIPGTGGNSFVTKESKGLYVSDECFKMALTDAISVACKALGMASDVYWDNNEDKYTQPKADLTFHNVFAIKQRVEEKITKLIKKGMDANDIFRSVNVNKASEGTLEKVFVCCSWLDAFEKELDRLS